MEWGWGRNIENIETVSTCTLPSSGIRKLEFRRTEIQGRRKLGTIKEKAFHLELFLHVLAFVAVCKISRVLGPGISMLFSKKLGNIIT